MLGKSLKEKLVVKKNLGLADPKNFLYDLRQTATKRIFHKNLKLHKICCQKAVCDLKQSQSQR